MNFEMEALLTQSNSEKFKSRFNTAFLAGSDYSLLPKDNEGNIYLWFVPDYIDSITDEDGEYKELKDFENPYLYTMKSK